MNYLGTKVARVDIDSNSTIWSIVFLAVLGPSMFILQPGYVQGLVTYGALSEEHAGLIAAFEMYGIASTSILMYFLSHRFNWRVLTLTFVLIVLAGNLASLGQLNFEKLRAIRFLTGLGSGGIISITFTMMGLTTRADRNMGLIVAAVLTWGALGLLFMPTLFQHFGIDGFMWTLAIFSFLGLFAIRHIPCFAQSATHDENPIIQITQPLRYSLLLGVLVYNLAIGIVWVYLALVGIEAGIPEQVVANVLTISQILGIGGALIAFFLEFRIGRLIPLQISIIGAAIGIALVLGQPTLVLFAAGVCLFNLLWNVTQPYFVAMLAAYDSDNKLVIQGVAMQMIGYAVGPTLAALLINIGGYDGVNKIAISLFVGAALVITLGLKAVKKQTHLKV
jgi:MFS family permease